MRSSLNTWILLSLTCLPLPLVAATNPVSWSVTPSSGFPATKVGGQSTVKYTLTNNLPFAVKMVISEKITGGNFTVRDKCHNISVASGDSCNIYVGFNPAGAEASTFQLVYGYDKNRIPTKIFSVNGTQAGTTLTGTIYGLPASIQKNDTPDFTVTYLNKTNDTLTSCTNGGTPLTLTGTASSTATLTNVVDNCNGNSIAGGASCDVTGKITGTSTTGDLTLTGNLSCTAESGSVTANPTAQTTVENDTGCTIHGYVTLPLPSTTYKYADNIVQFTFENECGTAQPLSTSVVVDDPYSAVTVSPSSSLTTCGSTLAANSDCIVTANIRAGDTGNLLVTASASTGAQTAKAVTQSSVSLPGYNHNVTYVNQCKHPVWIGIVNAGTNKVDPISPSTPDDYKLSKQISGARPATKTVNFPVEYLGGFWGRTGCVINKTNNTFTCATGNCPTSGYQSGQCTGAEPLAPFTGVEMNFFSAAQTDGSYDGVYDITMIGGVNIPIMMKGFGPTKKVIAPPPYNNSAFQCNSAGSPVQSYSITGLGSCSWSFTVPGLSPYRMPTKAFYFVSNDATPTSYNLDTSDNCGCGSSKLCGLAMGVGGADNNIYFPACGEFLGYQTINSLCSNVYDLTHPAGASSPITHFNCNNNLNTQFNTNRYLSTNTVADLYSCNFNSAYPNNLNSCFIDNAVSTCCGAKNWSFTDQDFFATVTNPNWLASGSSLVPSPYDSINWLTVACPTAYSYPFGDHFGSFYCKESPAGTDVKMDYEVVYCPAGTAITS